MDDHDGEDPPAADGGEDAPAVEGGAEALACDEEVGDLDRRVLTRELLNYGRGRAGSSGDEDEMVSYSDVVEEFNSRGRVDYTFCNIACCVVYPGENFHEILEGSIRQHCKVALVPGATYHLHEPVRVTTPMYLIGNNATIVVSADMASAVFVESRQESAPVVLMMKNVMLGVNIVVKANVICKTAFKTVIPMLIAGCRFKNKNGWCVRADMGLDIEGCEFFGSWGAVIFINSCSTGSLRCVLIKDCGFGVAAHSKVDLKNCTFVDNGCSLMLKGQGKMRYCTFMGGGQSVCMCHPHRQQLCRVHICASRRGYPKIKECKFLTSELFLGERPGTTPFEQCFFMNSVLILEDSALGRTQLAFNIENSLTVRRLCRSRGPTQIMHCVCGTRHHCEPMVSQDITRTVIPDRTVFSVVTCHFSSDEE